MTNQALNRRLTNTNAFVTKELEKRQLQFSKKSDKWKASDKGTELQATIDGLAGVKASVETALSSVPV